MWSHAFLCCLTTADVDADDAADDDEFNAVDDLAGPGSTVDDDAADDNDDADEEADKEDMVA